MTIGPEPMIRILLMVGAFRHQLVCSSFETKGSRSILHNSDCGDELPCCPICFGLSASISVGFLRASERRFLRLTQPRETSNRRRPM